MPAIPSFSRGMPLWREKQRTLPVGQKIEMLGRLIQETRQLEIIKKSCKTSAMSFGASSLVGPLASMGNGTRT
jgi:hypothetical protein